MDMFLSSFFFFGCLLEQIGVTCLMMCCAQSLARCVQHILSMNNDYREEEEMEGEMKGEMEGEIITEEWEQHTLLYRLLNVTDKDGWNTLRWACEGDSDDVVMLLLDTKKIKMTSDAFILDGSGAWIDPPWIRPYV